MKTLKLSKKLLTGTSLVGALLTVSPILHASEFNSLSTYVGVDGVYSKMGFKKDYGKDIFAKSAPGINAFVGHMFNENFGAELGYEFDKKKNRSEQIPSNNTVVGSFLNPALIDWAAYDTTVKQRHPYIGGIAKTRIINDVFASIMVGISASHIKAQFTIPKTCSAGVVSNLGETRTFEATKLIPIVRASLEYQFNDKIGVRALVGWKNTSRFKLKSVEDSADTDEVHLKNNINFGIGATYYII